jgi:ribosome-associated protein
VTNLKSKSQQKRDADILQDIGIELVKLQSVKLDELPLDEILKSEIIAARKITSHGALRRQYQLIGKLLRAADHEDIIEQFNKIKAEDKSQTANFHMIEKWRDRLIYEGGEALTAFISQYSPEDIQHLRQLVKKAVLEHSKNTSTGASRALFKYIRDYI